MKYKISLSTYNLDLIEAFAALKNKKSQFVEQALINFVQTKKGKDTLDLMTAHSAELNQNQGKEAKKISKGLDQAEETPGKLDLDDFLK